jgi:hypothetical protein
MVRRAAPPCGFFLPPQQSRDLHCSPTTLARRSWHAPLVERVCDTALARYAVRPQLSDKGSQSGRRRVSARLACLQTGSESAKRKATGPLYFAQFEVPDRIVASGRGRTSNGTVGVSTSHRPKPSAVGSIKRELITAPTTNGKGVTKVPAPQPSEPDQAVNRDAVLFARFYQVWKGPVLHGAGVRNPRPHPAIGEPAGEV